MALSISASGQWFSAKDLTETNRLIYKHEEHGGAHIVQPQIWFNSTLPCVFVAM